MKVLLVTGIFPPDHGGPASYVPRIAIALQEKGHEITGVITLSDQLDHDDTAYPFPVIRLARNQSYFTRWTQTVQIIHREARKADVVYLNGLVFEGIAATKFLDKKPAVIKVVGDLIWERARNQGATTLDLDAFQVEHLPVKWYLLRRWQGWYTSLADAVITPSAYLASIVKDWGVWEDQIDVIYNAVQIPDLSEPALQKYDLVTVARLVPWKGLSDLIDVVAEKGWSLRIVGDGPLRDELEEKARKIGANVSFAGQVAKEEVAREIRSARLFVLNSDYEGLPHIVLEAKAAQTAVLATAAGGTPETIEHGVDGWLIPPADKVALQSAIDTLLNDDELRAKLAQKGAESVRTRFNFDHMVEETVSTLQSVIA